MQSFGLIPIAGVITGSVLASVLSFFVVQSSVNTNHQTTLGENVASVLASQVNLSENLLKMQIEKIATSNIALDAIVVRSPRSWPL